MRPTVYDFALIGNARPVIVFDNALPAAAYIYGAVTSPYVRNITDVDDKINAPARFRERYRRRPPHLSEAIAR